MLFRTWNMFCTLTLVLSAVSVQREICFFFLKFLEFVCSTYVARIYLSDFEMVPVSPIITDITFAFTFHMHRISILRSLFFTIFSAALLTPFLSTEIATSINIYFHFSSSRVRSGLLLGTVLLVCVSFHDTFSYVTFKTCFYQVWNVHISVSIF